MSSPFVHPIAKQIVSWAKKHEVGRPSYVRKQALLALPETVQVPFILCISNHGSILVWDFSKPVDRHLLSLRPHHDEILRHKGLTFTYFWYDGKTLTNYHLDAIITHYQTYIQEKSHATT